MDVGEGVHAGPGTSPRAAPTRLLEEHPLTNGQQKCDFILRRRKGPASVRISFRGCDRDLPCPQGPFRGLSWSAWAVTTHPAGWWWVTVTSHGPGGCQSQIEVPVAWAPGLWMAPSPCVLTGVEGGLGPLLLRALIQSRRPHDLTWT